MRIVVRDVFARRGGQTVLHGANASFEPGRITAIVGPNGAGKTTLLRAIAGIQKMSAGEILLGDVAHSKIPPKIRARHLAYVPQQSHLEYPFTVREIVAMGRYSHWKRWGGPAAHDRDAVQSAIERTNLEELAARPVTRLSRGEHQRVLLARAIAQESECLLLDEPTSNLDLGQEAHVFRLLRRLALAGRCVAIVLHDLEMASRTADQVVLMAKGETLAQGPPRDVLTPPLIERSFRADVELTWGPHGAHLRVVEANQNG